MLRLLERGYIKSVMKKAYKLAKSIQRDSLLFKEQPRDQSPEVRFITTFIDQHSQVRSILRRYWCLLSLDYILSKHVSENPSYYL